VKTLHVKIAIALCASSLMLNAAELTLSGSVISDNEKSITSRYMGYVKEVRVKEGDIVKKGDLLYSIDSKEIDTALAQTDLAIAQAELSYEMYQNQYLNAKLNQERYERLLAKDMVSKYDVENLELSTKNLKAMMDIAQKQIAQAKQKRQEVQNQYHYLKIQAPNDSVVTAKHIEAGEMALAGVPALVLSDITHLKITAEIAETYLKTIKIGDSVAVEIPSIGCQSEGKIEAIVPSSNPMTHSFKLKTTFTCKNAQAYPGMYATLKIGQP